MVLTNKQEEGIRICKERYDNKESYSCIAGYAGTQPENPQCLHT